MIRDKLFKFPIGITVSKGMSSISKNLISSPEILKWNQSLENCTPYARYSFISRIDKRIYGSFVEHLGRAVY